MEFSHKPVLAEAAVGMLDIKPDGIYIDATAGGGGHSEEIAKRLNGGMLISLDRDPDAVEAAGRRLEPYSAKVVRANYSEIAQVLSSLDIAEVDGVLMDIGVSSFQLDNPERGFAYQNDGPLDMRMSKQGRSAADLIREADFTELSGIIGRYGEERFAGRIASAIIRAREISPVTTTAQLSEIIISSVPAAYRRKENPSRRTFQALRIAVNGELQHLEKGIDGAFEALLPEGVLAVITFHSLEDRIVKRRFADYATGCTCPPDFPVCVCGKEPRGKLVNKKPVTASPEETDENPRSRSAKLRGIRKI